MFETTCPICGKTREVKTTQSIGNLCRSCAKKKQMEEKGVKLAPRNCKFCGKKFVPNSAKQIYCKGPHTRICPVCGKEYVEDNVENLKRPEVACSYQCRAKATRKTSLDKYGIKAPGNNKAAREKSKKTMLARYGVEYAMQSKELKDKARASLIRKYGVDNASKCQQVVDKRIETNIQKYGHPAAFMLPENQCHSPISKTNKRFAEKLERVGIHYIFEKRVHHKYYDLYLPDLNTLIEIDPTYTHNSYHNHYLDCGLDKYYHRDKSKLAEENGFRCMHIFDWDNQDLIVEMLNPDKRIIGARECQIYRLNNTVGSEFLSRYHLNGTGRLQILYLGLVYNGEIVQVMSFGKSRYNKNYSNELIRMCSHPKYKVIGGFEKLFKYATINYGIDNIITYCDYSKFSGVSDSSLGMKFVKINPPSLIWSRENSRITDQMIRQVGFKNLVKQLGNLQDKDICMLANGWLPIYDCGRKVFSYIS